MDASSVFPQGVWAVIPFMGDVQSLCWVFVRASSFSMAVTHLSGWGLLPGCWTRSPEGQVRSGFIALNVHPAPEEVTTEAGEARVVTVNLCAARAGACSSTQKQPTVVSLSLLCSSLT